MTSLRPAPQTATAQMPNSDQMRSVAQMSSVAQMPSFPPGLAIRLQRLIPITQYTAHPGCFDVSQYSFDLSMLTMKSCKFLGYRQFQVGGPCRAVVYSAFYSSFQKDTLSEKYLFRSVFELGSPPWFSTRITFLFYSIKSTN